MRVYNWTVVRVDRRQIARRVHWVVTRNGDVRLEWCLRHVRVPVRWWIQDVVRLHGRGIHGVGARGRGRAGDVRGDLLTAEERILPLQMRALGGVAFLVSGA